MYYWDNAATTWPKPQAVREAIGKGLIRYGANPGRGGHQMAYTTSEMIYKARQTAADFFGLSTPDQVVFTLNCTMSLNMVIKGILSGGGRALISDLEHNAVLRPLHALSPHCPIYDVAQVDMNDPLKTVENFRRAITTQTKLIICNHASNVWGVIQPIREIGRLAKEHGIPFAVDAAQSAGVIPIDMEKDSIDFLCVAGHKGLYGPMGTGMLLSSGCYPLKTLLEGGTGSRSLDPNQPEDLPDRLESGTPNTAGICGLKAGMEWVSRRGTSSLYHHEMKVIRYLYRSLEKTPGIRLYTPFPQEGRYVPVLSFTVENLPSEQTAALLNEAGVAVRAGLHCAPLAHRKMGTDTTGTVRLSPSAFTGFGEAEKMVKIIGQTAQKSLQREREYDIIS